jgi:two-component system nitrate/nitrite response regulator NarL
MPRAAAPRNAGGMSHPVPPAPTPLRVLVADDHPLIRDGLVQAFTRDNRFEVVGAAADGQAAVVLAEELLPDCAVLDIRMPLLGGIEAMVEILRRRPDVCVVLLSAFNDEPVRRAGLAAGASAFLTKDVDRAMICDAVARVARAPRTRGADPPPPLTRREANLLALVADGWDDDLIARLLEVEPREIALRVQRLTHRLGADDLEDALETARRNGLLPRAS